MNERIFEIIPGCKQQICDSRRSYLRYPVDCSDAEKRKLKTAHDAEMIRAIPDQFGGENSRVIFGSRWRDSATIFDFLNVFTEFAKSQAPAQRLEIEGKAGALAKYIAENSRKFACS